MLDKTETIIEQPKKKFQFVGGALCLDFCNTVGGKREIRSREYLNCYNDFLSWSQQAGLINDSTLLVLGRKAERNHMEAKEALSRALALRECIYRIFMAIYNGKRSSQRDIECLNNELGNSLNRLRIVPVKNGFDWNWTAAEGALDYPVGPLARSAAELLVSGDALEKIRQCHGENCGWLFIDSSKNHSRCWCDMRDCGNRAKVRRHRLKQRKSV